MNELPDGELAELLPKFPCSKSFGHLDQDQAERRQKTLLIKPLNLRDF
jgi:hypothetical protein